LVAALQRYGFKGDLVKMPGQKAEYIIRIGHSDRYRHLHIVREERLYFLEFNTRQRLMINGILLSDMILLMVLFIGI